jgi:hypothetical protein
VVVALQGEGAEVRRDLSRVALPRNDDSRLFY